MPDAKKMLTVDDIKRLKRERKGALTVSDAPALIEVLKGMRRGPARGQKRVARADRVLIPPERIPVPADDPVLIDRFRALVQKMRVPEGRYRMRYPAGEEPPASRYMGTIG